MSSSESQQAQDSASHGRNVSHSRRQALPRRSTRGPLEGEDPLSATSNTPSPSRQSVTSPPERLSTPAARPSTPSRSPVPQPTIVDRSMKDFSFLQKPDNFHTLPDNDIPSAFRNSPTYPTQPTTLAHLLTQGHFRRAAILAAETLLKTDRTDHAAIFHLLYIRLACLQLTGQTELAAQESKTLQDLNDPFYSDPRTGAHLAPWELRVLAVRLQALGFGDWRRGVMGYYELAREARLEVRKKDVTPAFREECRRRLHDLGVRVANALLEMGDDETAARHMETLPRACQTPQMRVNLALVYVRLGDTEAAKACLAEQGELVAAKVVEALYSMAEGVQGEDPYGEARKMWDDLRDSVEPDTELAEIITQNLALCRLYVGDIQGAKSLFDEILDSGKPTRSLLFNLSTINELCAEDPEPQKLALSAKLAEMQPSSTGWEFTAADFKM